MLFLFNTTIMPNEGVYVNRKISLDEAKEIIGKFGPIRSFGEGIPTTETSQVTSAIGHQGSADAFNALGLNTWGKVEVNRVHAQMKHGDEAICLKVVGRIEEGQILNLESLNKIGFEFYHVRAFAGSWSGQTPSSEVHFAIEKEGRMYSDAI